MCNLLVVTRKGLRLIELATNHYVNRPNRDSPLTNLEVGYSYMLWFLGSVLIPWWVSDHSFTYSIFIVFYYTVTYYPFNDKLDSIIFRNIIFSDFLSQARLGFLLLLFFICYKVWHQLFLTDRTPYSILYCGISRFPFCLVMQGVVFIWWYWLTVWAFSHDIHVYRIQYIISPLHDIMQCVQKVSPCPDSGKAHDLFQ